MFAGWSNLTMTLIPTYIKTWQDVNNAGGGLTHTETSQFSLQGRIDCIANLIYSTTNQFVVEPTVQLLRDIDGTAVGGRPATLQTDAQFGVTLRYYVPKSGVQFQLGYSYLAFNTKLETSNVTANVRINL